MCYELERCRTTGQDNRSVEHNGLIIGENLWMLSAPCCLSPWKGYVSVQDLLFTASSSGNWNVCLLCCYAITVESCGNRKLGSEELLYIILSCLFVLCMSLFYLHMKYKSKHFIVTKHKEWYQKKSVCWIGKTLGCSKAYLMAQTTLL